jgi:S1-C subfamily serine protease
MKKHLPFLVLFACLGSATGAGAANPADAVVKVFATVRYPNPVRPWTNGNATEVFGSGTLIEGKKILTNSHLVLYATDVSVQSRRGDEKIEAKVEAIAPELDLAVLTLKDEKFFQKRPPLARARDLPRTQDAVVVYGFPVGGNDLAVTKGVVSRIRLQPLRRLPERGAGDPGECRHQSRQQRRAGRRRRPHGGHCPEPVH